MSVPAAGRNGTVLVIDDEAPIRRFLRTALTSQGFAVIESATAGDGIAQAAMRLPDIVLLDLGLPDLDGLEVTRRLREWSAVPILVLSARGQEAAVFEKFTRSPRPGDPGGIGLGLAIVKGIAEAHGGSVRVVNREGGGAAFTLELPREGEAPALAPEAAS